LKEITEKLLTSREVKEYVEKLKNKISPITILGLSDISKACIIALTREKLKRPIVIITYNELQAQNLYKNIKSVMPNSNYIPRKDIITYNYDVQSMDILYSRLEGILKLYEDNAEIIVINAETAMQKVLKPKKLKESILNLTLANEYNLEEIKEKLIILGYQRCDIVEGKGTFSVRGDILDIAISSKIGVRIEFFGDEVDQIRYFDISSQRSTENINQIKIYPLSEEIEEKPEGSIFEYLQESAIIIFDELNKIKLRTESILKDNELLIKDLIEKEKNVPYILENMYSFQEIVKQTENFQKVNIDSDDIIKQAENVINIKYEDIKEFDSKFLEVTKQEKRVYKQRTRYSAEFREAEKVTFSDLKVRGLCCT
jgi:transcription-repair coupling factor (superfamily II helicase)